MAKVDRSILSANDQQMGDFGDPNKLESSISHLADTIDSNDNDITTLKTDNTSNKGRLTILESDVSTLETENTSNKTRISTNESNIAYNEGRLVELLRNEQKASEVVDARLGFPVLRDKLKSVDTQLAETAKVINVRQPPYNAKGDGTTDDYAIILQASNDAITRGMKLYFPTPTVSYLVSQKFSVSQTVHWIGEKAPVYNGTRLVNGVVIEGHGIYITGGDGSYFENIGIQNPSQANGFQIYGAVKDTVFNNCVTRSRDHGFLAESYNGEVSGTKVYKCKAYGSIHGFVSKSKFATFQLCEAYSCTGNGFVAVSDNIPAATQKGINLDNKFIECFAQSCGTGFIAYSRDMWSDTNANGISLSGLVIQACSVVSATYNAFVIGDANNPPAGAKYNPVYNTTIANCTHRGSTTSALIRLADGVSIDGMTLEKEMSIDYTLAKNVNVGKINSVLTDNGSFSDIEVLPTNLGAVNVFTGRKIFKTANTANTVLTTLAGGKENKIITLLIDDNFTTINNGGNFNLKRSAISKKGSWLILKLENSIWNEVAGFQASGGTFGQNITSTPTLDIQKANSFDAFGSGTTTNKITFTDGLNPQSEVVTVLIRSSSGAFTYGGFDTAKFVVPSDLPLTVNFGTAVIVQWTFMAAINKWVCVSHRTSPYT